MVFNSMDMSALFSTDSQRQYICTTLDQVCIIFVKLSPNIFTDSNQFAMRASTAYQPY